MDETLVMLFKKSATRHTERTAIIYDDGRNVTMTSYQDLLEQCDQISEILEIHAVRQECVGVFGQLSSHTVSVLLGIMQSHCCFCPVGMDHPKKHFQNIMLRLHMRAFLIANSLVPKFSDFVNGQFSQYLVPSMDISLMIIGDFHWNKELGGFAYCITTSGTTGDPKIVQVPLRCIVPNITSIRKIYGLNPEDIVCQVAPLTFDPSVVELFSTLSAGSTLLMTPDILKKSPKIFTSIIQRHNPTVLQGTPTFVQSIGLDILLGEKSSLRVLSFGGEACPSSSIIKSNKHPNNKTKIFNLYGITEVSSWATCCEITEQHLSASERIPIGVPLEDTMLELRNEENEIITKGIGFLFVGGIKRQCLIDDEQEFAESKFRNAGDLIEDDGKGAMYCLGRKDDQIKRHGKRMNLLELEQVCLKVKGVIQAAAVLSQNSKLYLIIKPEKGQSSKGLDGVVIDTIAESLPSYYRPDDAVVYHGEFPYNRHGKIDKKKLLQYITTNDKNTKKTSGEFLSATEVLTSEWRSVLDMQIDQGIGIDSQFVQMGGDSFSAIRLLDQMETYCDCALPKFLDILLSGSFEQLRDYVQSELPAGKRKSEQNITSRTVSPNKCMKFGESAQKLPASMVRYQRDQSYNANISSCDTLLCNECQSTPQDNDDVLAVRRCGKTQLYVKKSLNASCTIVSKSDWLQHRDYLKENSISLKLTWTCNLGKCIDASPLAVLDSGSCVVYMGSHSRTFMAVSVTSGSMLWKATLGDRIESSAVLSKCTKYIVVGCYDGKLYVLDRKTGGIEWTFDSGGQIKCSPEVDPLTGVVYIGSHSHAVYGVDLQQREAVWCQKAVGGSIYSSPLLWQHPRQLYVASLSGKLLALNPDTGEITWSQELQKPVFSSPVANIKQVVLGCVDGTINSFSHSGGKLWQYKTDAPVFSSPCITTNENIICGSHDNYVHCLSQAGHSLWKYKTNSPVFSSPCVISVCDLHNKMLKSIVIACDTLGTIYLFSLADGTLLTKYSLPGELFSSPVYLHDKIIVGCRNDEIYCFTVNKN